MATQTAAREAATRIYIVRAKAAAAAPTQQPAPEQPPATPVRLIRAATPAQVARHLSRDFDIGIASQGDLEEHIGAGVRVEKAAADDGAAGSDGGAGAGGAQA